MRAWPRSVAGTLARTTESYGGRAPRRPAGSAPGAMASTWMPGLGERPRTAPASPAPPSTSSTRAGSRTTV